MTKRNTDDNITYMTAMIFAVVFMGIGFTICYMSMQ